MQLAAYRERREPLGGAAGALRGAVLRRRRKAAPLALHGRPGDAVPLPRDDSRARRRPARLPRQARRRGRRRARRAARARRSPTRRSSRRRCRAFSPSCAPAPERHQARGGRGERRRARHDRARRQGAGGGRRLPGRYRRPVVVPSHRDLLVQVGSDADDPAFLWRRPAREASELQRRADAVADDETRKEYLRLLYVAMTRARGRALRRRHPPRQAGGGLLVQRSWSGRSCRPMRRAIRKRPSSTSPMSGRSRRAQPLPRRDLEPAAAEAAPAELPDWLTRPAPSPVAGAASRSGRRGRWPNRTRGLRRAGAAGAALLPGADLALRRGRAVHLLLQRLPGVPEAERHGAGDALARRANFPDDPVLAESVIAGDARRAGRPGARRSVRAGTAAPKWRSSGAFATAQGDYAVSGRIDRLVRTGSRMADPRLQDRPRARRRRRRSTRPTSCSSRSIAAS